MRDCRKKDDDVKKGIHRKAVNERTLNEVQLTDKADGDKEPTWFLGFRGPSGLLDKGFAHVTVCSDQPCSWDCMAEELEKGVISSTKDEALCPSRRTACTSHPGTESPLKTSPVQKSEPPGLEISHVKTSPFQDSETPCFDLADGKRLTKVEIAHRKTNAHATRQPTKTQLRNQRRRANRHLRRLQTTDYEARSVGLTSESSGGYPFTDTLTSTADLDSSGNEPITELGEDEGLPPELTESDDETPPTEKLELDDEDESDGEDEGDDSWWERLAKRARQNTKVPIIRTNLEAKLCAPVLPKSETTQKAELSVGRRLSVSAAELGAGRKFPASARRNEKQNEDSEGWTRPSRRRMFRPLKLSSVGGKTVTVAKGMRKEDVEMMKVFNCLVKYGPQPEPHLHPRR